MGVVAGARDVARACDDVAGAFTAVCFDVVSAVGAGDVVIASKGWTALKAAAKWKRRACALQFVQSEQLSLTG